jgi:hypothetical protein
MGGVQARHRFHAVFQGQFALLEDGFFDLLGIGEVVPFGELMEAMVQLVVLLDKLPEVRVVLQQPVLYILRVRCIHKPPLLVGRSADRIVN